MINQRKINKTSDANAQSRTSEDEEKLNTERKICFFFFLFGGLRVNLEHKKKHWSSGHEKQCAKSLCVSNIGASSEIESNDEVLSKNIFSFLFSISLCTCCGRFST